MIRREPPENIRHLLAIPQPVLLRWYAQECPGSSKCKSLFMVGEDAGSCLRIISNEVSARYGQMWGDNPNPNPNPNPNSNPNPNPNPNPIPNPNPNPNPNPDPNPNPNQAALWLSGVLGEVRG